MSDCLSLLRGACGAESPPRASAYLRRFRGAQTIQAHELARAGRLGDQIHELAEVLAGNAALQSPTDPYAARARAEVQATLRSLGEAARSPQPGQVESPEPAPATV